MWGASGTYCRKLRDDERHKQLPQLFSGSFAPKMTLILEAGLYKLIQRSHKPEAKQFDRWLRHDVLPAIRKTGGLSREYQKRWFSGVS